MLRATSTFILCTYTIQSWVAQTLRHFLAVLLPLVQHYKYQSLLLPITVLYRRLRFHVLFSASVTFLIWNFILFPYVYLVAFRNKPSQRQKFMRWNFSFHLQQIHLCNIIFAYLNTVVYDHLDHRVSMDTMDLWVASFCIWMYSLFYLLILDRYGIHLYPIFSPRSHWGMALSGTLIWGILYLTFLAWNTWLRRRHFWRNSCRICQDSDIVLRLRWPFRFFILYATVTITLINRSLLNTYFILSALEFGPTRFPPIPVTTLT